MAAGDWWTDAPGLRQVFGSIVAAAAENQTTAQVWQTIRDAADTSNAADLSIILGREPTGQELADASAITLRGATIFTVNQARAAAGSYVQAHNALQAADTSEQVTFKMVADMPWSITSNVPGVQQQYRIRVQRDITVRGFTDINRTEWSSYNIDGPITSISDALEKANAMFGNVDYNKNVTINNVTDYSLEVV
jgi:CTP:molybdopterin cytidylyltransferase MocA